MLSFCLTLAALFPDYFAGEASLASSAEEVVYNVPFLAATAALVLALAVPNLHRIGVGLMLGTVLFSAPAYVRGFSDLRGSRSAGAGFVLGELGFAALLTTVPLLLSSRHVRGLLSLELRAGTGLWATVGAAMGAAYAVGTAMNWIRTSEHATVADRTFTSTGTAFNHVDCCTLLNGPDWTIGTTIALLTVAIVVPVLVACAKVPAVGLALLGAGALLLSASPLSAAVGLAKVVTPESLGLDPTAASQAGLVLSSGPSLD